MKIAFSCLLSDLYDNSAILTIKNTLPGLAILPGSWTKHLWGCFSYSYLFHSKMSQEHLRSSSGKVYSEIVPVQVVSELRCFKHALTWFASIAQRSLAQLSPCRASVDLKGHFHMWGSGRGGKEENRGLKSVPPPELNKLPDNLQTQ